MEFEYRFLRRFGKFGELLAGVQGDLYQLSLLYFHIFEAVLELVELVSAVKSHGSAK